MDVNMNAAILNASSTANTTGNTASDSANAAAQTTPPVATDIFEASGSDPATTVYKPDKDKIQAMIEESDRQVAAFRKMIESVLGKQAQKSDIVEKWEKWFETKDGKLKELLDGLEVTEEDRVAAQKEIDEGGYYSIEETAKRILDFAIALSGGDPSKIELLRGAVTDGYKAAEKSWGEELPEISQKTYEAVMNGFDEWKEAGSIDAISLFKPKEAAPVE